MKHVFCAISLVVAALSGATAMAALPNIRAVSWFDLRKETA